ncbi:MAG: sulfurtransferase [candidate division NC10 bacterium]|nr:sulfurtransferase [candidate division NC10 bacterium]
MTPSSRRAEFLVETAWLAAHLADPAIRIVDMRGAIRPVQAPKPWYLESREQYAEAHIPGAVYIGWLTDIVEPDAPVKMTVASPGRFAALVGRLGIGDEHLVVAYDDDGNHVAARLWWILNYYGHPTVRLLDGGYPKWVAEGRPVTAEVPRYGVATFTPRMQAEWLATCDEVRRGIGDPRVRLVDCRGPRDFRGEVGRGERKGRIPGAVNVPITRLWEGPHKTWKSEAELSAVHAAAGVTPDTRVITYCNAGVSASVGLLALKLLGYPSAANYAGSWYDWERDPQNPSEVD